MASIGIDGKGKSDSDDAGREGDMVAICDVDEKKLDAAARRFPKRSGIPIFRKMLDEMGKKHRRGDDQHAGSRSRRAAAMAIRWASTPSCRSR